MRLSKYTSVFQRDMKTVIFNSEHESLLFLNSDLADLFHQNLDNIENLSKIHPSLYEQLKNAGFIVPDDCNEAKNLIKKWEQEDEVRSYFGITINPTLNCNLRCWYCYESHDDVSKKRISNETISSVMKLIDQKTSDHLLKVLNVSFFGGEPLLAYSKAVYPILEYAANKCLEKGIKLYSSFTTNGTLLVEEVLSSLNSLSLTQLASFQITLDGNCELHNKTRVGLNNKPTYNLILENILRALKAGNELHIRFNYTYANILSFYDVIDDFKKMGYEQYSRYIFIKFEHVWQDAPNLDLSRPILYKVKEAFIEAGFNVDIDEVHFRHKCYADSPNHVVINYNGDIFKCTARDFKHENREGFLDSKGNLITNELYNNRMLVRYTNQECLKCKILPLCNGGCSQNKLEAQVDDVCYKHYTEYQKEQHLKARIDELLRKYL